MPDKNSEKDRDKIILAFSKKVKRDIAILARSKNTNQRVEAARSLGDAADPEAIKVLVYAYQKDKSKEVKAAAAEALAKYKTLGKMLADPDKQTEVDELLEQIVFEGRRSQKPRIPTRVLAIIIFILFLVGLALLMVGLSMPAKEKPLVLATSTPIATQSPIQSPEEMLLLLQNNRDLLKADAKTLTDQYTAIGRGVGQNCEAVYNLPPDIMVPGAFALPSVTNISTQLSNIRAELVSFKAELDQSCASGIAIPAGTAGVRTDRNIQLQNDLNAIDIDASKIVLPTLTPTEIPIEPTATLTPTSTPNASTTRIHVNKMDQILQDMDGLRGWNTMIIQNWSDIKANGTTIGCSEVPQIPENYVISREDLDQAPAELEDALNSLNLGLNSSRQAWDALLAACSAGTLLETADTALAVAENAGRAFDQAISALDIVRVAIR